MLSDHIPFIHSFIHLFIQTISIAPLQVHYYSEASQNNTDTISEFHAELPQATAVKDLPKVPTWRLERDSSPQPFGRKATNLPMSHHAPEKYIQQNASFYVHNICPKRSQLST